MTSMRALACGLLVLSIPSTHLTAQSTPMAADVAGAVVSLSPFRSVELRSGAHGIIRYGATHRVTFLKGTPEEVRITSASGDRLIIEKVKSKGTRGSEVEIEIVTPALTGLTVAHGGWIESRGTFPRQAELDANVDNGGTLDIRSMSVVNLTASVLSGGRIYAKPLTAMVARVEDGGAITYWGDPRVTQSIEHGGVITRGSPSDADKPMSEVGPGAVEAVSSIRPVRPIQNP